MDSPCDSASTIPSSSSSTISSPPYSPIRDNENNDEDKDNEIPNLRIPSQNWNLYIREPRTWKERLDQELAGILSAQPTDKEVKSTIVSCPACGEWKGVSKFASHLARCFTESQGESSQKPVSGVRPRRSSSSRSTKTSKN